MLTDLLIRLWEVNENDRFPILPDLIVSITYGSKREILADATRDALLEAVRLEKKYPYARIAFGCPSNCYPGSEFTECEMKKELLIGMHGINPYRVLIGGVCSNSITEAEAIKQSADTRKLHTDCVLVICTRIHARSIRYIWKKLFPDSLIVLRILPGDPDVERNHQILLQRGRLRWLLANMARHVFMCMFGLEFTKRIQHPNAG